MGYERNDRRPGYTGERGYAGDQDRWQNQGRDQYRGGTYGSGYGSYGGGAERDYRGNRFSDEGRRDYGRDPRGYDNDRGFFERAGDEVRSWFGDEEAERRRRQDEQRDQSQGRYGDDYGSRSSNDYGARSASYGRDYGSRSYGASDATNRSYGSYGSDDRGMNRSTGSQNYGSSAGQRDNDHDQHSGYRSWRDRQMQSFDRDYDDYRRENQSRFDQEFHSWRQTRQGQRDLVGRVREHQEVVGSDGQHIGTVDHVRGDNIKLTKSDENAGGHHHLVPCSWIQTVDEKVTLNKTADQAKQRWRDGDRDSGGGLFGGSGDREQSSGRTFDRAFGDTQRS